MRIVDVHVTPIAVSDPPLLNAAGLHAPYALRTIVELVADDGSYGLGEVPGSAAITGALAEAADIVIGEDPFQLNAIARRLEERFGADARRADGQSWSNRQLALVYSALEVACYDLMGKATGRPVVDLLGGRCRDSVPFSAYLFYKYAGAGGALGLATDAQAAGWDAARQSAALDPEGIVQQAQAMCSAHGFRSLKLKGGVFSPEVEVQTILALREAFGPDVPLRIDPNALWSVETAIRHGRALAGVIEYFEDPVRGQENMAAVRRALGIPLATNMCTTSFADLPGSLRVGAEDIILSDHHIWGGLRSSVELGRICRTFGRGLSMHSNSHVGISLAAMVHLAAAIPNLSYACDTHYPWQAQDVIVGGKWQFEDGCLRAPREPGLGIELDRDALAQMHAQYLACGLTCRDDELEMQKVQPGWRFAATRW